MEWQHQPHCCLGPEAASQDPQAIAPKVTDESESETLEDTPDYTLLQDGTTVQESMQISKILDARTGAKWGTITKIVDGDTVHIGAITYRLNLIDTPERGEEGFWEASNALKELCPKDSAILYDEGFHNRVGQVWQTSWSDLVQRQQLLCHGRRVAI